jgi:glycosyltransferase involved in cell wall biosynthesis
MQVIWQGVPLDDVGHNAGQRERVRSELGLDPGRLAIGTIANYVAQKDYPNLFEAVRRVSGSALARFFVIGQGPLARQVESLHATTGVADRVVLLGTRSDAVSVMAGWDIFVLASRFEGLPVALMEAMAMGLPIVATEVGGVPEAVRNGIEGLLVPPGRPDLLAAAIERLAGDESLRQTMGAAARQRSAIFDIRTSTRALEQMYLSALRHV